MLNLIPIASAATRLRRSVNSAVLQRDLQWIAKNCGGSSTTAPHRKANNADCEQTLRVYMPMNSVEPYKCLITMVIFVSTQSRGVFHKALRPFLNAEVDLRILRSYTLRKLSTTLP